MKLKHIYLLVLFVFHGSIYAQTEGTIVYRIVSKKIESKENQSESIREFNNTINAINRVRDSLRFNLDFNGQESVFYLDKRKNFGLSNEKGYNSLLRKYGSIFYRNEKTKTLIEQVNSDRYYLVNYNIEDIVWTITKEEKMINGYLCLKATSFIKDRSLIKGEYQKEIEAWFCPALAINIGPKIFGGLPGLILELNERLFTFYVDSIELNPKVKIVISRPIKGEVISRDEYLEKIPLITKENLKQYISD